MYCRQYVPFYVICQLYGFISIKVLTASRQIWNFLTRKLTNIHAMIAVTFLISPLLMLIQRITYACEHEDIFTLYH